MDPNFDRDRERSKPDSWKYDLVCDVAKGAAVQNESPRQSLKYGSFGVTLTSNTAIRSLHKALLLIMLMYRERKCACDEIRRIEELVETEIRRDSKTVLF